MDNNPARTTTSRWLAVPITLGLMSCAEAPHSEDEAARTGLIQQGISQSESTASLSPILDLRLFLKLREHGFSGRIEHKIEEGLGRPVDAKIATLGRDLFFDTLLGLHDDNNCSGCHSPTTGFGDTQSIAIGVDNNGIVGPSRQGPRNQRRTPSIANTGLYPTLMWNSRFRAVSGDPFDNSQGFSFPPPEGTSLSGSPTLLHAQAFIPPTERTEMAGLGSDVPDTNDGIRQVVLERLNATPAYRERFKDALGVDEIAYENIATAISEFEFQQTYANAPIDRFARGQLWALTNGQKRGALLFFGEGKCVSCHSVSGESNEMFSDFKEHNIGVPQIVPTDTNVTFDGPDANGDFGLEQITGDPKDHCKFRSSPLRNAALQPAYFHNGAFTSLEDAIWHHLDIKASVRNFNTDHLPPDLQGQMGSMDEILEALDPILEKPIHLSAQQVYDLVDFVRNGLLDPDAKPENLRKFIPESLPSGRSVLHFE